MKRPFVVAIAGIPDEIGSRFISKFKGNLTSETVTPWLPLSLSEAYTEEYAERLYRHFTSKLRQRERQRELRNEVNILLGANLVLFYLDKNDGSETFLFGRFGLEALVVPLSATEMSHVPLKMDNQRRRAVNILNQEGQRAIRRARELLSIIAEEITNRDNRTCLLLPYRNFGRNMKKVLKCVHGAASEGLKSNKFKNNIDHVSRQLPSSTDGGISYFRGQNRMIFKSPGKARGRHGLAPTWTASEHELSCIIRGRMRFGASYDPKFHYDCAITKGAGRQFPNCHGEATVPDNRSHVNIAPNDNVR